MNRSGSATRRCFSRDDKRRWVSQCLNSELSQHEFARRHQLGLSTLQRWIAAQRGKAWARNARKASTASSAAFIEVKAPMLSRSWAAEVVRRDGAIVRVSHDAPAALIQQLLSSC